MADERYVLYGTDGCHLCEEARALVETVARSRRFAWCYADIALDDGLVARYGTRIPVLRDRLEERELQWPFGLLDLARWLR